MTGGVNFGNVSGIHLQSNSSYENSAFVATKNGINGSLFEVYTQDSPTNPGIFLCRAMLNDKVIDLTGYPNGMLTWGGKEVERVNSSGSNVIRYESGLQICYGNKNGGSSYGVRTITFPVAFSVAPIVLANYIAPPDFFTNTNLANWDFQQYTSICGMVCNVTATSFIIQSYDAHYWIAIGRWK